MEIRVSLPHIPAGAVSNLLGLVAVVAIVVAIGGLTGNWWWSVLAGGVFGLVLAVLAQSAGQVAAVQPPAEVPKPGVRAAS